jgi:hypothetical protein
MEQHTTQSVDICLNTNIYSYLATSCGQSSNLLFEHQHLLLLRGQRGKSSNLCLNVFFSTPVVIRHLWKLKTVVLLHWYLICALLLSEY